jgi:hypothetical protein
MESSAERRIIKMMVIIINICVRFRGDYLLDKPLTVSFKPKKKWKMLRNTMNHPDKVIEM